MMDDLAAFIRGYTRDLLPRVRYAGSVDPQSPMMPTGRDFLRKDDPNLALRTAIMSCMFGSPSDSRSAASAASDELIHDLFVAHWEFAVGHDCGGHQALVGEVLRRNLHGTFVHAYTLPLGMDQGIPLEIAIDRQASVSGTSPIPLLLLELELLLESETRVSARKHLVKWRLWMQKKG